MLLTPLTALSPLDGRYAEKTASLQPVMSEYGLIRFRVMVEVQWLLTLFNQKSMAHLPKISDKSRKKLISLHADFNLSFAEQVKAIEKTTNHDVKAVEYFIQKQCENDPELAACIPLRFSFCLHFRRH